MYVKGSVVRKTFGVSHTTLHKWVDAGHIQCIRMPNSTQRLYDFESVQRHFQVREEKKDGIDRRAGAIYARVSSEHQRADLDRQVADLLRAHPDYKVFKDVASGLNYTRPGLQSLLECVRRGEIGTVAIMHRDRLCRFGHELLAWIFAAFNTKVVVQGAETAASGDHGTQELSEDLISIVTVFVARHNGQRSAENRKRRAAEGAAQAQAQAPAQPTKKKARVRRAEGSKEGQAVPGEGAVTVAAGI